MIDPPAVQEPYAIQYSTSVRMSRDRLPAEARATLADVLYRLADNPDAFPNRTRRLSRNGLLRVYVHLHPAMEITFELDMERRVLYFVHFVVPQILAKPIFISYSRQDGAWLQKMKQLLVALEDRDLIRIWDDTEIPPGADWRSEVYKAIESARVAVLLVTQAFLDSEFVSKDELPRLVQAASDRAFVIFWVAVKPAKFAESPLARFQCANLPQEPLDTLSQEAQETVLRDICKKLEKVVA